MDAESGLIKQYLNKVVSSMDRKLTNEELIKVLTACQKINYGKVASKFVQSHLKVIDDFTVLAKVIHIISNTQGLTHQYIQTLVKTVLRKFE